MRLDPDLEVSRGILAVRHRIAKIRDHGASECQDRLAVEEPLEIRVGGISLSVTICTPSENEELVACFLVSESITACVDDLDVVVRYRGPVGDPDDGNVAGDARVAKDRLRRIFVPSSSLRSLRQGRHRRDPGALLSRATRYQRRSRFVGGT